MNYRWCFLFKVHRQPPQTPDKDIVGHSNENKNKYLELRELSEKMAVKLWSSDHSR